MYYPNNHILTIQESDSPISRRLDVRYLTAPPPPPPPPTKKKKEINKY